MSHLLCALYYTFVFVYSHCLLVQVNQYMLACMVSVDVVLICRPALFFCVDFAVFLIVVLFYRPNCRPVLSYLLSSCHLFCRPILSSYSVVMFCRPILSSCSVVLFCRPILSSYSVVLFCLPNCRPVLSS